LVLADTFFSFILSQFLVGVGAQTFDVEFELYCSIYYVVAFYLFRAQPLPSWCLRSGRAPIFRSPPAFASFLHILLSSNSIVRGHDRLAVLALAAPAVPEDDAPTLLEAGHGAETNTVEVVIALPWLARLHRVEDKTRVLEEIPQIGLTTTDLAGIK